MNSLTITDDPEVHGLPRPFLRQLPESVRVVLARDPPTSITDLVKAADDILTTQSPASGIAAVSAGKMSRRAHPPSGKTGTCCFYHVKFGEKACKCGNTSSAATCDMAHLIRSSRNASAAASRQSGRQSLSRLKKHDVCLGS